MSIGKRKFNPCMFAAPVNAGLWASCIYLLTGNEEYGSPNDQLNDVYRKFLKIGAVKRDPEERNGFIRFGKTDIITSAVAINTLDSLDFEKIPELKEKFDKKRKKENWEIIIYTNGSRGLLFLNYSESVR